MDNELLQTILYINGRVDGGVHDKSTVIPELILPLTYLATRFFGCIPKSGRDDTGKGVGAQLGVAGAWTAGAWTAGAGADSAGEASAGEASAGAASAGPAWFIAGRIT